MNRLFAAAVSALALALFSAGSASAAIEEPVSVTASGPDQVAAKAPLDWQFAVDADPAALDIATQPLRLRVRLAPECGGSFAGTEGPTVLDAVLPAPAAGAGYHFVATSKARLEAIGEETVCAFLEDGQERQFATDTEATLTVVGAACAVAGQQLTQTRRGLRRLRHRIVRVKKQRRNAHGERRRVLGHRLRVLRHKRHRLVVRKRRAQHQLQLACTGTASAAVAAGAPRINHLFVIVLENEDVEKTFGANTPAPYLGKTLREAGTFIPGYYGIGHESLDNYIAMVSGQPPNVSTQADCQTFSEFLPGTIREDGVALGQGCVYPRTVQTVANQLENSGQSWRGYMQDMANSVAAGEPASCRHPASNTPDTTQMARAGDQYAVRHNPFVYFHSIIDFETCRRNDLDLSQLPGDLATAATTPAYAFITPDLCADGHDETCADGTSPGSFAGIDAFLREWVPRIQASPAYRDHGAILITFDESESGAESCCNEPTGPNTVNNGGPTPGSGGGKVGAVLLSPCVRAGTISNVEYNHYSFLRWTEDNFGLAHLANAGAAGLVGFGSDVFTRPSCDGEAAGTGAAEMAAARVWLKVNPRRAVAGRTRTFRFRLRSDVAACTGRALIRFAGRRVRTNLRGRAKLKLRVGRRGKQIAVARPLGCPAAKAKVRVIRPKRHQTHRGPTGSA